MENPPQQAQQQAQHPPPPPVSGVRAPHPLVFDNNLPETWKIFRQTWNNYAIIIQVSRQPVEYQCALLLHTMGSEALRIYNGFDFATPEAQRTTAEILAKFEQFSIGTVNKTYERFVFNKRQQQEGETFESFVSSL
jgi:hypothetical protein